MSLSYKQTKIVCTIGPASANEEMLRKMIKAGMNVARFNFSHGTHEYHKGNLELIRRISQEEESPVAILLDLQGPKIRVGVLPKEGIVLETDDEVTFISEGETDVEKKRLIVTYPNLHGDVKAGERILLDDGLLSAVVLRVDGPEVVCRVIDGGVLTSSKGVNFPDSDLTISALSDKDKRDVTFGVENDVDWMALSFVRTAKEVYDLRYLIKAEEDRLGKVVDRDHDIKIIVKVEKREAVENIEEILEASDGIMVARGDLGVEMPAEQVPLIQKRLIDRCLRVAKPVIVATQMLDSMIRNPRPTRAEVSDIANAVIDHTDAVMLSGETASGKYPLQSLETMATVVQHTEASHYDFLPIDRDLTGTSTEEAVAEVANILARQIKAKAILVASISGRTARVISRYRTELPIYAVTNDERVRSQLALSWGVTPFLIPTCATVEELTERAIAELKNHHHVKEGQRIIVVAGEPVGTAGGVNMVEIREIK